MDSGFSAFTSFRPRPGMTPDVIRTLETLHSVDLRAGSANDGRPFRKLRLDEIGRLPRAYARRRVDAGLLQAGKDDRICQRLVYRAAQTLDDRRGRICRRKECRPGVAFEARQA